MSSVQGEKKCPKCGGVMFYDFDCNTTEEHRMCLRCGLTQAWDLLWNEDGTVKKKEDGTWLGNYTETVGYGVVKLIPKTGIGHIFCFDKPLSETDKEAILKDLKQPDVDSSSYAVMYDPESNTFTALAGTIPGEYEDGE